MLVTKFLKLLWDYSPRRSAYTVILTVLASLTEGFGLVLLVPLLGAMQTGLANSDGALGMIGGTLENLGLAASPGTLIGLFVSLVLVRAIIQYFKTVVSSELQMEFLDNLRSKSFRTFTGANWKFLSGLRRSDHTNILLNEIDRVGSAVLQSFALSTTSVLVIAYLVVAFVLSIPMTLLSIAVAGCAVYILRKQHAAAQQLGNSATEISKDVQQVIEEGLAGVKLTKTLGNEQRHNEMLDDHITLQRKNSLAFVKLSAISGAAYQVLVAVLIAGLVWVGIELLELSFPTLLTMVLIFVRLAPMVRNIQIQLNQVLHSVAALENLQTTLKMAEQNQDSVEQSLDTPVTLQRALTLNEVSFGYGDTASLQDINLVIAAHKTTAIMGSSGSGKSTLADIIMGLLSPETGQILADDTAITNKNMISWRRSIAYVSQDIFLFNDSIRNNLLWAKPDASDAELFAALDKAAADFVKRFDDGIDSVVGDGGMRLSGGERQRIALARALLQKPQLLILDEATSALDVENERKIVNAIQNLHGELTVIVVGHRLPTLEHADQVIVVEGGKIAKQGTWAQVSTDH